MPPKVEFTGDPKQLIKALDDVNAKYIKLQQVMAGTAQQSNQHHNEAKKYVNEQISSLTSLVAGYFTVSKAIELVADANRVWNEEQAKIAERVEKTTDALVKQLSLSGNLLDVEKARAALTHLQTATPEQALTGYGGVQAGGPQLAQDMKLKIAKAISPLATTGRDIGQIGTAAGQIATLGDMTPEEAAGKANIFQQKTGGGFEKGLSERKFQPVRALEMAGFDRDRLLAMETVAVTNQMGSVLKDVSSVVLSQEAAPRGRAGKTPEGKAKRLLASMTQEERMAAIESGDERVTAGLPQKLQMAGKIFDPALMDSLQKEYAAGGTSVQREVESLQATPTGREKVQGSLAMTRKIEAERPGEDAAMLLKQAQEELDISLKEQGAGGFVKSMAPRAFETSRWMHSFTDSPEESIVAGLRSVDEGAAMQLVQRTERRTGQPLMPGSEATRDLHTPEIAAALKENSTLLRELIVVTEKNGGQDTSDRRTTATPTNPNQN